MNSIDDEIADCEVELRSYSTTREWYAAQIQMCEKRVAELRAKKAAESKTVGQRMAETCVQWHGDDGLWLKMPDGVGGQVISFLRGWSDHQKLEACREYIAAAIDKAATDATLAEREACAEIVEGKCYPILAARIRARGAQ